MISVRVWEDDIQWLRDNYPDNHNAQIRRILGNWIDRAKSGGTSPLEAFELGEPK